MEIANFLAQVYGFSSVIVCLSFLVKPKHLKNLFAAAENETHLLFIGMANVFLGVTSLLLYSSWDMGWQRIITLLGWVMIIKGIIYLFIPETAVKYLKSWQAKYMQKAPIVLVVGVAFGCLLVYLGSAV